MTDGGKRWLWGITGLAAYLRFPALFANSFHADEALFASFARHIAVWRDPLLQLQPVDKPPLLFYAQALFYPLFGPVEWAARLPNFIASLLLVSLVGVWAWRLFGDEKTAVLAALFTALLPLAIQFSATAFTDPLLTTLLVASLATINSQRPATSNQQPTMNRHSAFRLLPSAFFFGLAVMTKHQAWLFLPLLLGLGWLNGWHWAAWRRWLAWFLPMAAALLLWDWARMGSLQLWSAQAANFGGIRLIWSWELWPRLRDWAEMWGLAFGSIWLAGVFLAIMVWAGFGVWHGRSRQSSAMALLLLFSIGYILLHWLLAVPIWDRYLLPLIPILALILARQLAFRLPPSAFLILFLLLPGAWLARDGRFPIGGQPNADQGAATVAQALDDAPYGAVLYDHWGSWQWRYHLFDKRVYVSWFPSPAALAEELAVFGEDGNPHYLVLPDTAVAQPVTRAVAEAGFQLQPVPLSAPSPIQLYEIKATRD